MDKNKLVNDVMKRLQFSDAEYLQPIRDDASCLLANGWTVDETVSYLRCLEHVSPNLPEKVALDRMDAIRVKVKERKEMEPRVAWFPTRPDLTIVCEHARSTSTNRGYHESYFQITSRHELGPDDIKALSDIGLLGMGQAFMVTVLDSFVDTVKPVTYDKKTGKLHPEIPPMGHGGAILTSTSDITYYRYEIKRICDSGD